MTNLKRWRIKPSGSTISISQISRTTLSILQDRDVSAIFLQTETPPTTPSTTMELQEDGFMTNSSQIKKSLLVCGSFSLFLHLLEPRVKIYTTGRIFLHEVIFYSSSIENTIQIVNLNDFVTENSLSNLFSKGTHSLLFLTNLHSWIHHLCKSESEQFWQVQCIFLPHSLPISREPPPSPTEPTIMLPRLWSCSIRAKLMVAWLLSLFFVCFPPLSALCPLENPFWGSIPDSLFFLFALFFSLCFLLFCFLLLQTRSELSPK